MKNYEFNNLKIGDKLEVIKESPNKKIDFKVGDICIIESKNIIDSIYLLTNKRTNKRCTVFRDKLEESFKVI